MKAAWTQSVPPAVAGGCKRSAPVATQVRWLRTHPLPRGGSDCVQVTGIFSTSGGTVLLVRLKPLGR